MRPVFLLIASMVLTSHLCSAQLVHGIIGVKRTKVQQLLRPYHILDYESERVVYAFDKGVRQTVIFENDTCYTFFWAVDKNQVSKFMASLQKAGFTMAADTSFTKGGLRVEKRPLESGKAVLFYAIQDFAQAVVTNNPAPAKAQESYAKVSDPYVKRKGPVMMDLPRMQQEVLAEQEASGTPKAKDPTRNWVGKETKTVSVLGWEK